MRCVTLGGLSEGRGREMTRWPFEVLQAWHTDKSPSHFTQQSACGTCHCWMTGRAGRPACRGILRSDPVGMGSGQLPSETRFWGPSPTCCSLRKPRCQDRNSSCPLCSGHGAGWSPSRAIPEAGGSKRPDRGQKACGHYYCVVFCLPRDSVSLCDTLTVCGFCLLPGVVASSPPVGLGQHLC